MNAFGNAVHSLRITKPVDVDISGMPRGMYVVELLAPGVNGQQQIKRVKVIFE